MSNPVNVTAFVDNDNEYESNISILRNEDELVGSLLPVATPVVGGGDTESTIVAGGVSATPINTFDYESAILAESSAVNVVQEGEGVAFSIPPRNHMAAIADDSRSTIKRAQHMGLIAAEEEMDAVRRANQNAHAKNYYTQQAIQAANQHARARVTQEMNDMYLGTTTTTSSTRNGEYTPLLRDSTSSASSSDRPTAAEQATKNVPKESTSSSSSAQAASRSGGYQVGSYQVKEYEIGSSYTSQEYEIQEYKSVYD